MMSNNRKMGPESDKILVGKVSNWKFFFINLVLGEDFFPIHSPSVKVHVGIDFIGFLLLFIFSLEGFE